MAAYKSGIFFLADGARPDVVEELLAQGRLPNLARYLIEPGAYRRASTVFPSTTGPAYLPFLTGRFPGPCNVPGIRWFDPGEYARTRFSLRRFRSYVGLESMLLNSDIAPNVPTLFEIIPKSINLFSVVNKGATRWGDRTRHSRIWFCYYAHLTDRWGFMDRTCMRRLVGLLDENPGFVFAVLPAIDEYSHLSDPFSPATRRAYEQVDQLFGQVVQRLKELGRLEETLMILSSDHGLSTTRTHFGVDGFLERQNLKTLYYPLIFKTNVEAASMVSGNGMCHVYVRKNGSWKDRSRWEDLKAHPSGLVERLLEQDAVDLVFAPNRNGSITVRSRDAEGLVIRTSSGLGYQQIRGNPLGLPEGEKTGLSVEDALRETFNSPYPDSLVQLTQLFESPRSGDLVISAKPGYDLRDRFESPEHHASHGSLHREHMLVPMISNARLAEGPMRTVDVYSTFVNALCEKPDVWQSGVAGVDRRKVSAGN